MVVNSKKGNNFKPIDKESFIKRLLIFIAALMIAMILTFGQSLATYTGQNISGVSTLIFIVVIVLYGVFSIILLNIWKSTTDYAESNIIKGKVSKSSFTNLILALIVSLIFHLILMALPISKSNFDIELNIYLIVVLFIFQVIIAPIVEETVVRGLFLSMFFKKKLNIFNFDDKQDKIIRYTLAILISAFISTALHGMSSYISVLSLLINGVLCGILYMSSKNILTPIIFHMINNFFAWLGVLLVFIQ